MNSGILFGIYVILANVISIIHSIRNVPIVQTQPICIVKDYFSSLIQCDRIDGPSFELPISSVNKCDDLINAKSPPIFILYDVNAMEGFNLRRDVYIRMAVFLKKLRQQPNYENTRLVLPPFYRLYHWNLVSAQRHSDKEKDIVFWNHFFSMNSLKRYTDVIDIWEYFEILKKCVTAKQSTDVKLDYVFQLRHFDSMFQTGKFEERFEVYGKCSWDVHRSQGQFNSLYTNFTSGRVHCVEFQGAASLLHDLIQQQVKPLTGNVYSIALLNAETVLHDHWGGVEYWRARRSMRFNPYLVYIANAFRWNKLKSNDIRDHTERPIDWRDEMEHRMAVGGGYVCAHLRRADFLRGREKTTPSLRSAATQISTQLKRFNLTTVFIASDCTGKEFHDLKGYLKQYRVVKFTPASNEERDRLRPGGVAIVDQIICSHSRFFIGTYESTFTYRIYEEREILSFPPSLTFNTFCKMPDDPSCSQNSVWQIVYDEDRWDYLGY